MPDEKKRLKTACGSPKKASFEGSGAVVDSATDLKKACRGWEKSLG
jgi:hypothetical protein